MTEIPAELPVFEYPKAYQSAILELTFCREFNDMKHVHKQILTDENNRPIAVQIPYDEWLTIEELLKAERPSGSGDPSRLAGTLQWGEDGVAYQRRVREEWAR